MTYPAGRLAVVVAAIGLVGACTSNSATTSSPAPTSEEPTGPSLDGVYTVETGPYEEYVNPMARPMDAYRVAFRSACADKGCVATETSVGDDNRPVAGQPARIFDFIDGDWRWAGDVDGTCSKAGSEETLDGHYFKSMSLTPHPDATLSGTLVTLGGIDPCQVANHAPVMLTRVADVDPSVPLTDPTSLVAPVASPAAALHGTYDYHYTDRMFGTEMPVARATASTYCLRTGTRCATLLLHLNDEGEPERFQVLTYADQHWTQTTGGGDVSCAPQEGIATKTVVTDFPLPSPPTNPIATLTGVETTKWDGPCPTERPNDVVLNRTGD
jgi:hypothetical protein